MTTINLESASKAKISSRRNIHDSHIDGYSEEYCRSIKDRIDKKIHISFEEIDVEGIHNIQSLPEDAVLFYVAPHKSHMDYVAAPFIMHKEGLPFPRIAAGENLLPIRADGRINPQGIAMKYVTGIDAIKAGVVPVRREKDATYVFELCNTLEKLMCKGKSVLVFTEKNGKKTGRSYDGTLGTFKPATFEAAITAKDNKKNSYIVPYTVSYDFVPEALLYPSLIDIRNVLEDKRSSRLSKALAKAKYTGIETRTFMFDLFHKGAGKIHIDFGKPIEVKPKDNRKELVEQAQEQCSRLYRVTSTAVLCTALLEEGSNMPSNIGQRCIDIESRVEAKDGNMKALEKPSYDKAMDILRRRKVIDISTYVQNSTGSNPITIKNQRVAEYFRNTIAHLL